MGVIMTERDNGKTLVCKVTGKLDKEDYDVMLPLIEATLREHKKINMLIELHQFEGWTAGALWEDIKFDLRHLNDINRLAVWGERKWEENLTKFTNAFTTAKVKFFEQEELEDAMEWISEGEAE